MGEGSAALAIRFGEERRPEAATHVRMAEWEGPLGLLLSLIEGRRLDVLSVPLGALAEAYLDALAGLDDDRIGNISSFVAIASQLILIKSRAMLPRQAAELPPDDDEAADPEEQLRARLVLYRAYRDAGVALQALATAGLRLFRREPGAALAAAVAGARPPDAPPLDPESLPRALAELVRIAPVPEPPPGILARSVTIGQRAAVIREALRGAPGIVLQDLLQGVRDRVVVVVTFLAMLELMKRHEILVEQAEPFGPIRARNTTTAERAAAGVPADVDAAPIDESLADFA